MGGHERIGACKVREGRLGVCLGCGARLLALVVCFARCSRCAAENYVPSADDSEVRVARFWSRASTAPVRTRPYRSGYECTMAGGCAGSPAQLDCTG